jgi:heme-degrading monooxygenase HmoA
MLCALTVRRLKPGTFEDFRKAFMGPMNAGDPPPGWVRFNMIRNAEDPDEVVCFGFFDGSLEDLQRESSDGEGRSQQQRDIEPYVASTGADGLYEVVENLEVARA